jgi:starch synthase
VNLRNRVLLTHPMGNANVREALRALYEHDLLAEFWTTIRWDSESMLNSLLPGRVRAELNRRSYPQIPGDMVHTRPWREVGRLLAIRAGVSGVATDEKAALSATRVFREFDHAVAERVRRGGIQAVFAYVDGALETFHSARGNGIKTVYELTSTHGEYARELLREEAELCPEWANTIARLKESPEKNAQRDQELELSDLILIPCQHVLSTLPKSVRARACIRVCPYGAPPAVRKTSTSFHPKLRVLFVGSLTQAKGLGYLLRAVRKVGGLVELTLIGTRVGRCAELDDALARYRYLPTLPHSGVLAEMGRHDVLAFPSLSEGYGLVILEALSRGLPVITTRNTGGPEIIRDGREGFFVPIRSDEAIAEKLEMLAGDRDLLEAMSEAALQRASECTWQNYRELLASTIAQIIQPAGNFSHA